MGLAKMGEEEANDLPKVQKQRPTQSTKQHPNKIKTAIDTKKHTQN